MYWAIKFKNPFKNRLINLCAYFVMTSNENAGRKMGHVEPDQVSYGIIIDFSINAPCYGNNIVDGLDDTKKLYLKEQMELLGKLASKNTSNIGMISSASKDVSIKVSEKCLYILNMSGGTCRETTPDWCARMETVGDHVGR